MLSNLSLLVENIFRYIAFGASILTDKCCKGYGDGNNHQYESILHASPKKKKVFDESNMYLKMQSST